MVDCPICGDKLPIDDFEIQHHLINHEERWIERGRE